MPKIFEIKGYKFFFFSNEGCPLEPCHIHIRKGGNRAKFWIEPIVGLASAWRMSAKELNYLENIVEEKSNLIKEKWCEHFNA
ncbi:MAG: DUF4160 domain-containing protein [bacterium]